MPKPSAVAIMAQKIAQQLVAEQTRARISIGFDAALIAAHEVFQMGPGRAAAYANAYGEAMDWLATLFVSDATDNKDDQIVYAKAKRDELLRKIVGDENFVPFDQSYGQAYTDELKRIRIMEGKE